MRFSQYQTSSCMWCTYTEYTLLFQNDDVIFTKSHVQVFKTVIWENTAEKC